MKIRLTSVILTVVILGVWYSPAEAARSFTIVQTPSPVALVMGTTNNQITFRVTNNSTAGEAINRVRFNINTTYTSLPNPETFVAPTGWTCTRSSNTRITCTASSATYYITPGTNKDFTFNINSVASTADRTDQLASAQGRFSGSRTYFNPNTTTSSWTWKALQMTLVPSSVNIGGGCQFTLTMTITNRSTSNLTGVTSVNKPPSTINPSPSGVSLTTTSNPTNLTLNAGQTLTMVWTYTAGSTAGTIQLTACAATGASCTTTSGTTRTSSIVTTPVITISATSCTLTATIAVTPTCLFSGGTATFTMTVSNSTGSTVNNVIPSALTRIVTGSAAIGTFTGPAPASYASIANGTSQPFTWTATVAGNVNDTYAVSGNAQANGPITTSTATSTAQDVDGYLISVDPPSVNANSTNQELTWRITNYGCTDVKQVRISIPSEWGAASITDNYSLVDQVNPPNPSTTTIENLWTISGTNPTITFDAPTSPNYVLPLISGTAQSGNFSLLFSSTPPSSTPATSIFTIRVTDTSSLFLDLQAPVTVADFNTGASNPNENDTNTVREDIR